MATGEIMNAQEKAEQGSPIKEVADKAKELGDKIGDNLEQKYTNLKEDRVSKRMLNDMGNDFKNRGVTIKNETVKNALDKPTKENVKAMQDALGYNKNGKNFYNPIHKDKMQTSDGQAGPFTLAAINNMAVDPEGTQLSEMSIPKEGISKTEGVKDFIGTMHPYFFNKFKNADANKFADGSNEKTILTTMKGILDGSVQAREQIQNMQVALNKSDCYPPTHQKENKDGVPGPYTQVALQNFVLKNLKDTPTT